MSPIRRPALAASGLVALALSVAGARPVAQTAHAADDQAATHLGRDPVSGRLIFVGTQPGRPVPSALAGAAALPAEQSALSFVREFAPQLGLRDVDSELALHRSVRRRNGRSVVRYRQVHSGVPVFAADVVVNTNRAGSLLALSAKLSPDLTVETEPAITADEASAAAVEAIAKYDGVPADALQAGEPELWIYDSRLLQPDGRPPVLTWKVEVSDGLRIREVVLVNAMQPTIELHYNKVDTSWSVPMKRSAATSAAALPGLEPPALGSPLLSVYTMGNTTGTLPGALVCTEADPAACAGDPDAQASYQYGLDTYALYASVHGRDSIDGMGMRIVQSVHYGLGYMNAYWNGNQMVFGDGFSAADDVVAHELTHGVTSHESDLIYWAQPGAINESFSDIWGEFVDQTNGHGLDVPTVKWLMGEDVPGLGAIRSLKNPPAFKDPDSMLSPYYSTLSYDGYGVHTNSGVGNKTAYLLVEGGAFGGKTVAPLGWEKTADIFYEAQTNLIGSGTNYLDLYYALQQACFNLVGTDGITLGDCQTVRDATVAVKMNATRSMTVYPTVDYCPAGQVPDPAFLFDDDFEGGRFNWDFTTVQGANPWALDTARGDSSSGSNALFWSPSDSSASEALAAMNADILLPRGSKPYVRIEHDMWGFESGRDGGIVEYSANGGATWSDLGPLFAGGKNYTATLSTLNANPLGGRKAFTGTTQNYTESLYSLASLAGYTFRIRFRVGTDASVRSGPWFVDDVRIYTCAATPSRPVLKLPANGALMADLAPTLDWTDSTGGVASYNLQLATDSAFTRLVHEEAGLAVSQLTVPSTLENGTKYVWRVRSLNSAGDSGGWTAPFVFYTAMTAPALVAPEDGAAVRTRRPTFDWLDIGMATGYTLQVSTHPSFMPVIHTGNLAKPISLYTPVSDLPANATLYWRLRANTPKGPSPWSPTRSLTTGNPPGVPVLLAPLANFLTWDYTPRFDWAAPAVPAGVAFDHYQLQVADSAGFASPAIDVDVAGLPAHEYTPTADLAPGTPFYWRVRAWSAAGDSGGWSPVRCVRTVMAPPTLSLPADGGYSPLQRPVFDWSDVFGAAGYTIQVSRQSSFSALIMTGTVTTPLSNFVSTVNLTSGPLYWRVRANGPNGPSGWSSTWTVTVPNPPSTPALISPGQGAWVRDLTPRFDWSMAAVPAGTTFAYYELALQENSGRVSYSIRVNSLPSHEYTVPSDLPYSPTWYWWRVRAVNTADEASAWSAWRWFYLKP